MQMPDYFPKDRAGQIKWLENFSAKLARYGKTLGLSAEEIAASQRDCLEALRQLQAPNVTVTGMVPSALGSFIREEPGPEFLLEPCAAKNIADTTDGPRVRITFIKLKHEGVCIEMRRRPEFPWRNWELP